MCGIRAPDGSGGDLWCWGFNENRRLGAGTGTVPLSPTEVATARDWLRVDLGLNFACAISAALELYCWGYNDGFQVSSSTELDVAIPTASIWPGVQFQILATGWAHSCAVTAANTVLCWGNGGVGQLGDGNQAHRTPVPVVSGP